MVIVTIKFEYEDKKHSFKACLKNDMTLSDSKQNQATDLVEDSEDDRWSLIFDTDGEEMYEAVMYRNNDGEMTTEAERVIVWGGNAEKGIILDEVDAKSSCKRS